jgi:hypothetical protein
LHPFAEHFLKIRALVLARMPAGGAARLTPARPDRLDRAIGQDAAPRERKGAGDGAGPPYGRASIRAGRVYWQVWALTLQMSEQQSKSVVQKAPVEPQQLQAPGVDGLFSPS